MECSMEQGGTVWLSFVMPFLVALVTASITTTLALGKFKKEKAWEKKEEAYFLLIDAIKKSIEYDEAYLEMYYSHAEKHITDDVDKKSSLSRSANEEARRVYSINYIFMRRDEVILFDRLFERLNFHEHMDGEDMATLDIKHKRDLLSDAEEVARIELHAKQSNLNLLFSTLFRKFDDILTRPVGWIVNKLNG